MAIPSGESPGNSIIPETQSAKLSTIPSQIRRFASGTRQSSAHSTTSSTRSFAMTKTLRPNSVTPRCRCTVVFGTNMDTTAVTLKSNAICSRTAKRRKETFIPLGHLPGERMEVDFGHIHVDFPDGRRLIPFLVTTWAYSNCPFVLALPFERTEAILEGMVRAFEFFGCVPKEVWWDNPKTVATAILVGRERRLHPRYAALASHYVFNPLFCTPRRGNEKPDVENTVRAVQRRFSTPVPRVRDLDELNQYFRQRCAAERARTVQSLFGSFVIGDRFAEEQAAAAPLPRHRFDPCVIRLAAPVDKYQTAAFDGSRYSVPRPFAFQAVTVKGYVHQVVIVAKGEVVARHARSPQPGTLVLDPVHYLATLDRKPGALDHAPVYRDWKLPACFGELRAELEKHHGALAGAAVREGSTIAGRSPDATGESGHRDLPARATAQRRGGDSTNARARCPRDNAGAFATMDRGTDHTTEHPGPNP